MNISYNKSRRRYEAYTYLDGKKISLGLFLKKYESEERLEAAQEALNEDKDLVEWIASNPNKKAFSYVHSSFEEEFNQFLIDDDEPRTKDGYHKKLGFSFTNFKRIQEKYKDELKGKTHIAKKVPYFDFSPDLFRDKQVNFRYWRAHLAKIGKQITYVNLHITEFELKLALMNVFQKNIYLPKKLQPDSNVYQEEWRKLGEELDEVVQECIYGLPERKPKLANKIIFNPEMNLTKEERKEITINHTSQKRKNNTLEKLLGFYEEGMSKKALYRESGISLPTIRNHWEKLIKQAA